MREVIQAIRAIWHSWSTGDRLDFSSEHFSFNLMTPNFTPPRLQGNPPPIHIAAVGPAMLRLAARECDGVMLHSFCSRHYLTETILPLIEETLQRGWEDTGVTSKSRVVGLLSRAATRKRSASSSNGFAPESHFMGQPQPIGQCSKHRVKLVLAKNCWLYPRPNHGTR